MMQSYGDLWPVPTKMVIFGREACGAYTKFAADMASLAITAANVCADGAIQITYCQFMVSSLRSRKLPPQLAPTSKR